VGLEDDPKCGKLQTTQNPGSLKIHELIARGPQTTPKLIKYQPHINQEMSCQIHGGSRQINICNASGPLSHA